MLSYFCGQCLSLKEAVDFQDIFMEFFYKVNFTVYTVERENLGQRLKSCKFI